jgi:translation initiation factor IF-3
LRRRFRRPKKEKFIEPRFRANERIFSPTVFVIDEQGKQLGEMETKTALETARARELDLVEVSPNAQPPVCRFIDYGKFQYQQAKQEQQAKSRQHKVDIKGVRIGLRTDEHDILFKREQVIKFLSKGHKIKIEVVLRGREKAYREQAKQNLRDFVGKIDIPHRIEEDVKSFPGGFNMIIAPE